MSDFVVALFNRISDNHHYPVHAHHHCHHFDQLWFRILNPRILGVWIKRRPIIILFMLIIKVMLISMASMYGVSCLLIAVRGQLRASD